MTRVQSYSTTRKGNAMTIFLNPIRRHVSNKRTRKWTI